MNCWKQWEQPEPSLHEIRQKYGATVSDEELILRFFAGSDYVDALPNGGKPREYLDARQPLVKLLEQLATRSECHHVFIQKPGFSVRMEKKGSAETVA